MLNFSKIKIIFIYLTFFIVSAFCVLNFFQSEEYFFKKKINLGLDLQGGSYLLLEVDTKPLINQRLQEKVIKLRDYFKKNNIKYKKLSYNEEKINISFNDSDIKKFEEYFLNKDNDVNDFYDVYRSYEMEYLIENNSIFNYLNFNAIRNI